MLRGAHGSWPEVCRAQYAYERRPDSLLVREAAQLRVLADLGGPRVCAVVGLRSGVVFTESVPGPTLMELLLRRPGETRELLQRPLDELRSLHRPGSARHLDPAGVIAERSIEGTFSRKFHVEAGAVYVDRLGTERLRAAISEEVTELVRASVDRLHRLRMALPAAGGTTLAYGDLKPEHVVFPDGPDGRPVLLDPGLLRAGPVADLAKLLSRTVLHLVARPPDPVTTRRILDGLALLALSPAGHLSVRDRRPWLRHLLTLGLMDTINITATYLSAPAALPLPSVGIATIDRALRLCRLFDAVSADLLDGACGLGDRTLDRIAEVIS
ncbi:phosphotransferase [Streptomyces sp. NPDC003717]|uniref:phosphotransferase n=1 Tax=Streptomyces sp. NPDC003717 TaxID=3154276 RepID=UPI0033B0C1CB